MPARTSIAGTSGHQFVLMVFCNSVRMAGMSCDFLLRPLGQRLLQDHPCGPSCGLRGPARSDVGVLRRYRASSVFFIARGRLRRQSPRQGLLHLADVHPAETRPSRSSPPAVMISSCSRWLSPPITTSRAWAIMAGSRSTCVGHQPGRDPVQLLRAFAGPDLGPQQPQAHLHQPVVQVDQHHVVPALGQMVVEDDGADARRCADGAGPRRRPPNFP